MYRFLCMYVYILDGPIGYCKYQIGTIYFQDLTLAIDIELIMNFLSVHMLLKSFSLRIFR